MKTTTKSEGYKLHSTYADTARGQKDKQRWGWVGKGGGTKGKSGEGAARGGRATDGRESVLKAEIQTPI